MSKKILVISALVLVLTVTLTACKSKKNDKTESKPENTDKVVQTVTVTGEDGGVTKVEVYEDQSGDKYITNVQGDKIPLTTDSQGFNDDIGFLVTSTTASSQKAPSSTKAPQNTDKPTASDENTSGTKESSTEKTTASTESSTGSSPIIISPTGPQDTISWDDIKNPKK